MAPRSRLLDLERHDVLFFSGTYHHHGDNNDSVATPTHAVVFWPVFLLAALVLHLVAPFPHAAAICAALYVAYCFVLDRAAWARLRPSTAAAGAPAAVIEQKS